MYYLSYISNTYSTKNKLEEAIKAFIEKNDREMIQASEVEVFKQKIIDGIDELNAAHKRCKPITASWWQPNMKTYQDIHLHLGASICNFSLHQSKVYF